MHKNGQRQALLKWFSMGEPIPSNRLLLFTFEIKSIGNRSPPSDSSMYRHLVRSLLYLPIKWPGISNAVQVVNQFVSSPHTPHLTTIFRILKYIHGTLDQLADLFTKVMIKSRHDFLNTKLIHQFEGECRSRTKSQPA